MAVAIGGFMVMAMASSAKERGTGLGLAISKKVVDAHGGSIEASSQPGSGAEFTVTIPKHLEKA